jgi:hypothetical protein
MVELGQPDVSPQEIEAEGVSSLLPTTQEDPCAAVAVGSTGG